MTTENPHQNEQSIADFEALKTAIANSETALVKDLLTGQTVHKLEIDYLLELARLGNDRGIIKLLEDVPQWKE
ncbi:hypothetical protein [Arsukibacterium sp.]|uniref:hypothetical protein n=1 Tax=Arsukibacterium sp. TaxID=1977258 RepID=UPI003568099C